MKKVAFFVNSLSGGGAEKILQTLLNRWNGNRWQVVVYSIRKEDIRPATPGMCPSVFCLTPSGRRTAPGRACSSKSGTA